MATKRMKKIIYKYFKDKYGGRSILEFRLRILLILASTIAILVGITISTIGIKVCAITAGIKKYNSVMTKRIKSMIKQCC